METLVLKKFFMWCTIIDGGLLFLWITLFGFAPDLVYRTQRRWFPLSRDAFGVVMYSFLGLFKVFFLMFNLVPFIALSILHEAGI